MNILVILGLGENFIKWVKIRHTRAQAAVLTKGFRSEYSQRGDAVLPFITLLFPLAREPLAEAIRVISTICCLETGQLGHKITFYALR